MGIRFEDPPPMKTGVDQWEEARSALIENSGTWAVLVEAGKQGTVAALAHKLKNSTGSWRGHRWDATTRTIGDGKYRLYGRHVEPLP